MLVNTIYMKAAWPEEMDTGLGEFTSRSGTRDVPVVEAREPYHRVDGEGFEALSVPFSDPDLSAVFILPDEGVPLASVEAAMGESGLPALLDTLAVSDFVLTEFRAPKLSIEGRYNLADTVKALGAPTPFDENRADFSARLKPGEASGFLDNIVISKVIHKTVLDLDEIGVEAAAVTAIDSVIVTGARIEKTPPKPFIVDRPFLLVLTHGPTGAPLFLARVNDPGVVSH